MNALQIIALLAIIVAVAGLAAFLFQAGSNSEDDQSYTPSEYTNEELQNIALAEQLYDKDLRPIVPPRKQPTLTNEELPDRQPAFPHNLYPTSGSGSTTAKTKEAKPEFPIDKPKKKRKYHAKAKK